MGDVVQFNGLTKLKTDPSRILQLALKAELADVVVVGFNKDGDFWFSGSDPDGSEVLWLLERARHKLMLMVDKLESEET